MAKILSKVHSMVNQVPMQNCLRYHPTPRHRGWFHHQDEIRGPVHEESFNFHHYRQRHRHHHRHLAVSNCTHLPVWVWGRTCRSSLLYTSNETTNRWAPTWRECSFHAIQSGSSSINAITITNIGSRTDSYIGIGWTGDVSGQAQNDRILRIGCIHPQDSIFWMWWVLRVRKPNTPNESDETHSWWWWSLIRFRFRWDGHRR